MGRLLKNSHKYYVVFVALLCCLPFFPVLYFLIRKPEKYYGEITVIRKWILGAVGFLAGIHFDVRYARPIDWDRGPYIFCANHSSIMDVFAIEKCLKKPFSFLGKDTLLRNPLTSMFFRSVDIPVNRSSKISSYRAYKRCREVLDMGHSLTVFPEGGIASGNYPPRLQDFKNGLFKLAIEKGIPIVPVVIHDLWKLCWDEAQLGTRPGLCHVQVLEPIDTKAFAMQEEEALKALVHGHMEACIMLFRENVTLA